MDIMKDVDDFEKNKSNIEPREDIIINETSFLVE